MSGPCIAAVVHQFGGIDQLQLQELSLPTPGRGEIVVKVKAAAVNPIDTRRRAGYGKRMMKLLGAARMPLALGNDFAGTVCAVGRGVTTFREGDAVFGVKPPSSNGSHASHVVVDAGLALHQPPGMHAELLATLPYNFLTVTRAMAGAGITRGSVSGRKVLVNGASGGLGLLAIRLLQTMGAEVTAVAGNRREVCRQAGATHVMNRHTAPLRAMPAHFSAILNFGSWDDEASLLGLLAPGATGHATTVHPMLAHIDRAGVAGGLLAAWSDKRSMAARLPRGARYAWTVFRPDRAGLEQLADIAPMLHLPYQPVRFALSRAAQAHQHVEQGQPGRAILIPAMK